MNARAPRSDQLGILASSVCAVHCVAGAVLAGTSAVGMLFTDERVELAFTSVAVLVAATALSLGSRRHRRAAPLLLGLAGFVVIAIARLGRTGAEVPLSVTGTGLLVAAHVVNIRALRRHRACCDLV